VLKGKYYPTKDFLEATRKKKSSETWCAILFGREALVKGLIKRVGPGDSINVWSDNWIPGTSSMKPLVRLPGVHVEKVCELFIPGTRSWDEQRVRNSFCTLDATEILSLKPGAQLQEDLQAWAFERSGVYSVRSCYRILKREDDQQESFRLNETRSSEDQLWWKKVWKLNVPPKIRIFWWRLMQNYLPSKAELMRRHVTHEDHCEACGEQGESLYHVVFQCTHAIQFWRAVKELIGCRPPRPHPASWARDLLSGEHCSLEEAALFICGAWALWTGRNARRHGRNKWSPAVTARHVASMIEELIVLNHKVRVQPSHQRTIWQKPDTGWVKVNTDASFVRALRSGSGGAVLRDEHGDLLRASARWYDHCSDVLVAEVLAARDGMMLAQSSGCKRIVLELDNKELVNLLSSDAGERSSIAGLWHEIMECYFLCETGG
jgi:hypothetical protein